MYKIYLDTSDRYKMYARLLKDEKIVDEIGDGSDPIIMIRELLLRARLSPDDINYFEAHPGPGSFTGLKIGITIVNALNWALGKKSISQLIKPDYGSEPNIHQTKWIDKVVK